MSHYKHNILLNKMEKCLQPGALGVDLLEKMIAVCKVGRSTVLDIWTLLVVCPRGHCLAPDSLTLYINGMCKISDFVQWHGGYFVFLMFFRLLKQ